MTALATEYRARFHRALPAAAGAATLAVGLLVLAGWIFDVTLLKSLSPSFVAMKVNSALGFVLLGTALLLAQNDGPDIRLRRVVTWLCLAAGLIAALSLTEDLAGINLHIDQWLIREPENTLNTFRPGRMSLIAALNLLLAGAALPLMPIRPRLAQALAIANGGIALFALIGYLYGVKFLYSPFSFGSIAPHNAGTFFIFSLGVLFVRRDAGLVRIVVSDTATGVLARRLLPAAVLFPIALGWLMLEGQKAGLHDFATGLALLMAALALIFTALLGWTAFELARREAAIQQLGDGMELQVRERTAQLETANRELESFSYSVSHDLRAPLRHVQGYVEMLARASEGRLDAKAGHYLKTIADASVEMGQLIDDLLAFSRMGRVELQDSTVDLDAMMRETLRGLEPMTMGRNIDWKIAPLPRVQGDPAMLRQVLANLIGNAVKYSRPRDAAQIEIGLAGEENGRDIFFVRDNGVGFDMQYGHKLFGVFQRLHRADEFEGNGIGLATVRRVITRHGGRTWAEGKVGAGATFYFTLQPAAPPPPQASTQQPLEVP